MLEHARDYVKRGYSVIPLLPKDKKPLLKWEPYQKRQPTDEELTRWFAKSNNNIGIVTGSVSNLSIIDLDGKEAVDYMTADGKELPVTPMVKTGKEYGYHLYLKHEPQLRNFQTRADLPHIDMRSEGGYVVAPPSIHPNGKRYEWFNESAPISTVPAWFLSLVVNNKHSFTSTLNNTVHNNINSKQRAIFEHGRRDEDLFHVANRMVKGGLEPDYIQKVLELIVNSWGEHDPKWVNDKIQSALKNSEKIDRNITQELRDYISITFGSFNVTNASQAITFHNKASIRTILHRLSTGEGRIIEPDKKKGDGWFKKVEAIKPTNWAEAEVKPINICYPFAIDRLVYTLPKSIVVVAGTSDAGKTAFLLNLLDKNCEKFKVHYFSSEMGPMEIKDRLSKFDYPPNFFKDKFDFYEYAGPFAQVIKPDGINIIDYLEIEDFTQVAIQIRDIFDKLETGIAVIAIQKKFGADLARGGELSMEKARLYINLDPGVIKIRKAKNWRTDVNPNGLFKTFKLVKGNKFMDVSDWKKIDGGKYEPNRQQNNMGYRKTGDNN